MAYLVHLLKGIIAINISIKFIFFEYFKQGVIEFTDVMVLLVTRLIV